MMKVLVTGSRSFANVTYLEQELAALKPDVVVHGGASGADALAEAWCKRNEVDYRAYPAKWRRHGKAAGPIRNLAMLAREHRRDEPIDVCLAFPVGIGRGTRDMMAACEAVGVPVLAK